MHLNTLKYENVKIIGGFLKNVASPSGLGHWFRNLVSLEMILKTSFFRCQLTFDINASTYKLQKKSSELKLDAKFVATTTDFGGANFFFKNPLRKKD